MKNEKFEQAKQAVAKKYEYRYYEGIVSIPFGDNPHKFWEDVFKFGCNEAVKADRLNIEAENPTWVTQNVSFIDDDRIHKLPLPFPQQPDER